MSFTLNHSTYISQTHKMHFSFLLNLFYLRRRVVRVHRVKHGSLNLLLDQDKFVQSVNLVVAQDLRDHPVVYVLINALERKSKNSDHNRYRAVQVNV